jgi:hypothetical protein
MLGFTTMPTSRKVTHTPQKWEYQDSDDEGHHVNNNSSDQTCMVQIRKCLMWQFIQKSDDDEPDDEAAILQNIIWKFKRLLTFSRFDVKLPRYVLRSGIRKLIQGLGHGFL